MENAVVGAESKAMRWWSIESQSREKREERAMTCMLLDFLGVRRKRYCSLGDIPLLSSETEELKEQENPATEGLEAIGEAAPDDERHEPGEEDEEETIP